MRGVRGMTPAWWLLLAPCAACLWLGWEHSARRRVVDEELERHRREGQRLRSRLDAAHADFAQRTQQWQAERARFEAKVLEAQRVHASLASDKERLRNEIDVLLEQAQQAYAADSEQTARQWEEEKAHLEAQVEELNEKGARLAAELKVRIEEADAFVDGMVLEVRALHAERLHLEDQVRLSEAKANALNQERARLVDELKRAHRASHASSAANSAQEAHLAGEVRRLNEEKARLAGELEHVNEEKARIVAEAHVAEKKARMVAEAERPWAEERADLNRVAREQIKKIKALREENVRAIEAHSSTRDALEMVRKRLLDLEQKNASDFIASDEEKRRLERAAAADRSAREEAEARARALEDEARRLEQQNAALARRVAMLRDEQRPGVASRRIIKRARRRADDAPAV
jgi:chromosome segregation ATPase